MKKKIYLCTVLMLVFTLMLGISASAGFKKMPNGKYRYYVSKTKYLSGKKSSVKASTVHWTFKNIKYNGRTYTYCFDENGYVLKGLQELYTSQKNGTTGWFYYYFDSNGRMLKNACAYDRYFQKNGRMLTNAYGPNNTYYGANGIATSVKKKAGFVVDKKGTKYINENGVYAMKTWKCIKDPVSGKYYWHYFYSSGYMAVNTKVGDHFVDANGRKVS